MDLVEASNLNPATRHPWELARGRFFDGLLRRSMHGKPGLNLLDVGSGDGFVASLVHKSSESMGVTCWDINYTEKHLNDLSTIHPGLCFTNSCPDSSFDVLMLLDVLEHVKDDSGLLKKLVQEQLRPEGYALISVPAWPVLFSHHDHCLHHYRRYTPELAKHIVKSSGLRIISSGGLFHSLLLPRLWTIFREKMWGPKEIPNLADWSAGPFLTVSVNFLMSADTALTRLLIPTGFVMPGLSWWALCQK